VNNPLIDFLQLSGNIPSADQELIHAAFPTKTFREGEYLSEPGKICRERFFICKGILRIVVNNGKGVPVTYYFLRENQFCTILQSFNSQEPADEGIQAACEAEVIVMPRNTLLDVYKQIPTLRERIDRITQQALLDKIRIRNAYLGQDAATRYHQFMQLQPEIALRVSLSDIASYLEITPQSLSRIRKTRR
jgi:CRP-like cAMP-binding protein